MSRGRDTFRRVKPALSAVVWLLKRLPRSVRYGVLALFRGTPGPVGLGVRYACVRSLARSCGDNVYVGPYAFVSYLERCDIGSNVSIREFCNVGCLGGAAHGRRCLTGQWRGGVNHGTRLPPAERLNARCAARAEEYHH